MKITFRIISLLSIIIILLIIGSELALRKIPNDYTYKSDYLKENGSEIQTLILGSSHTFTGVNPKKFSSNTFNAAHSSQTLNLDYKILESNKQHLTNLKTIIIPISYFSFTSQLDDFNEDKIKYYNIYWDIDTGFNDLNKNYELFSEPIAVNYNKIKNYFLTKRNQITVDTNGYVKIRYEPEWNDITNSVKAFKRHRFNMGNPKTQNTINKHYQYLESIIKYGKKNNIQIVLLSTPTTELYKNYVIKTHQYFNLKNNVKKLSKYDNVIVIDYFLNNKDFTLKDFKDSDHLSAIGADKLSIKVDSIINKNPLN